MDEFFIYLFIILYAAQALLAFIPANVAKNKGYSFGLWWFYGWMLFATAIIHACMMPHKNSRLYHLAHQPYNPDGNAGDELKKYKELLDCGVITQEEFQIKKEQLLKMM